MNLLFPLIIRKLMTFFYSIDKLEYCSDKSLKINKIKTSEFIWHILFLV